VATPHQKGIRSFLTRSGSTQFPRTISLQRSSTTTITDAFRRLSVSEPAPHPVRATPRQTSQIITRSEIHEAEQPRIREEKLVSMILKNDNLLWEKLALASDSILSGDALFSRIHLFLKEAIDIKDADTTTKLLSFCIFWVEANWANKSFIKAIPAFEDILKMCKDNSFEPARSAGVRLEAAIIKNPPFAEQTPSLTCTARDFLTALDTESYTTLIKDIAGDMTYFQVFLYCKISPHALIKKWNVAPAHIVSFNKISNYLVTLIVSEPNLDTRAKFMGFFLDVAKCCLEKGDLVSPRCIWSACNNVSVSRLKKSWALLDKKHTTIFETLESFYSNEGNYRNFRPKQAEYFQQSVLFLPLIELAEKDLASLYEGQKKFVTKGDQTDFNFEKLDTIFSLVHQYLSLQTRWKQTKADPEKTNFIFKSVKAFSIPDEEWLYAESLKREPKLTNATSSEPPAQ